MLSLKRNCWFCNTCNSVSVFKLNSWTCNSCEQYNGFTKDGDYNKAIPAMYHNSGNSKYTCGSPSKKKPTSLCEECNLKQEIKLNKLTNYESKNETTYDFEIEMYKNYLDKLYDLCDLCKSKVRFEICKQDGIIKQYEYMLKLKDRNQNRLRRSSFEDLNNKNVKSKGTRFKRLLNVALFCLVSYLAIIDYFQLGRGALPAVCFYLASYAIAFVLVLLNNCSFTSVLITLLTIVSMYSEYLNVKSTCLPVNLLILSNLGLQLFVKQDKEAAEEVKYTVNTYTNDQLSKIMYNQNNTQAAVFVNHHQQQHTTAKSKQSSVSLIDFANQKRFTFIKPATLNLINKKASMIESDRNTSQLFSNKDSTFNDSGNDTDTESNEEDDSSSIISGMTNLYLEKTRSSRKSKTVAPQSSSMCSVRQNVNRDTSAVAATSNSIYTRSYKVVSILMAFTNTAIVAIFLYRIFVF